MKKWILAAAILLLALVVPIPTGANEDGSRSYTALTYKIVDWHFTVETDGNQVFDETKIYPFPLNFSSMDELMAREKECFIAPYATAPAETTGQEHSGSVPYKVQYIRTDHYDASATYPMVFFIQSREQLDDYFEHFGHRYWMEQNGPDLDEYVGFFDTRDRYDDTFFEKNELIMVLLEEGSGSIRHKLTDVVQSATNEVSIYVQSIVPEIGTCDMAQWHVLIDIPATGITLPNFKVYLDEKLQYDATGMAVIHQDESLQPICVFANGEEWCVTSAEANAVANLLLTLDYSAHLVCKCLPQYRIETDNGSYGVHLDEGYARCEAGQAKLTSEQIVLLRTVIQQATQ